MNERERRVSQHVRCEESDGLVVVRIDRSDVRNAFARQTLEELTDVATTLRRRSDVHAVILTGGDQVFSVGQDLRARNAGDVPSPGLAARRTEALIGADLTRAWEEIEAITIAAIEGHCIGGSCALVLACDFRIMGAGAVLRLPEVPLGMSMPWQTIPRLASIVGASRAKRLLLFGEPADAERCLAWGLADETTAAGGAVAAARAWAKRAAALPPIPARMTKGAVNAAVNAIHHLASYMDRDQYLLTMLTDDVREGVAAFREKRAPEFNGR